MVNNFNNGIGKSVFAAVLFLLVAIAATLFKQGSGLDKNGRFVMRYSKKSRAMSLVLTIVFLCGIAAILIVENGWPRKPQARAVLCIVLFFEALCAYMLFWFSRIRILVFKEGIAKEYVYGSLVFIPWGEITKIESRSVSALIYILTDVPSRWISVSHVMDGIDVMFRVMKQRLHPSVYGNELEKPLNNRMRYR